VVGDSGAVIFIREYAGLGPGETNRKAGSGFKIKNTSIPAINNKYQLAGPERQCLHSVWGYKISYDKRVTVHWNGVVSIATEYGLDGPGI